MNLQEQISRIKLMMGGLNESEEQLLDKKNPEDELVEKYWSDETKTEDEKLEEVKNYLLPIFEETKKYYFTYIEGDWFTKKIEEKIKLSIKKFPFNLINKTESGYKKITIWGAEEKKQIKDFINNLSLEYVLKCNKKQMAFVNPNFPESINFCVKTIYPSQDKSFPYQVILHEMKHSINQYFMDRGVNILPKDVNQKLITFKNSSYEKSSNENSSRVQNLRMLLGVDDLVSVENFIKLLKEKLVIKNENLEPPVDCVIEYNNNEMVINTEIPSEEKNNSSLNYLNFYFGGQKNQDIKRLFNNFTILDKTGDKLKLKINLQSLFNYSQEFAKIDTKGNNNYA
jgi:hypothetical protein